MQTAISILDDTIKVVRIDQGAITLLSSLAIGDGVDPVTALANAPLPRPLGPTCVVLSHPDLLLRPMVQPPAPPERMERIVRFELQGLAQGDDLLYDWHIPATGGMGDMRILALIGKRSLVQDISAALAQHGGRLTGLMLPGEAAFHVYRRLAGEHLDDHAIIFDLGLAQSQCTIVMGGELLFIRAGSTGAQAIFEDIAALRGLSLNDARDTALALGATPPQDLQEIIQRHAANHASAINNHLRFARAQFRLEELQPSAAYLSGIGGQMSGFAAALGTRLSMPCRLLNPFAGLANHLDHEDIDQEARLPSPWTAAIGGAAADGFLLNAVRQVHDERRTFWCTSGALRSAAAITAVLLTLTYAMLFWRDMRHSAVLGVLTDDGGLLPEAQARLTERDLLVAELNDARQRVAFLDAIHLPQRLSVELLNVIAELQDPRTNPIFLTDFSVERKQLGAVEVTLVGFAQDGVGTSAGAVLDSFKTRLQERYPAMGRPIELPVSVTTARQAFHWVIEIPDRHL